MAHLFTANTKPDASGFALIEVLIAILVFSIGIMGLIGIQASSIRAQVDSKSRAQATLLANQVVGDIWTQVGTSGANLASFSNTYSAGSNAGAAWSKAVVASGLQQGVLTVDTTSHPPQLGGGNS